MTIKILKSFRKRLVKRRTKNGGASPALQGKRLQSNCFLVWGARCVYNQFAFTATAGLAAAERARQTGPLTGLGEKEA
jgi:hypothetical protein